MIPWLFHCFQGCTNFPFVWRSAEDSEIELANPSLLMEGDLTNSQYGVRPGKRDTQPVELSRRSRKLVTPARGTLTVSFCCVLSCDIVLAAAGHQSESDSPRAHRHGGSWGGAQTAADTASVAPLCIGAPFRARPHWLVRFAIAFLPGNMGRGRRGDRSAPERAPRAPTRRLIPCPGSETQGLGAGGWELPIADWGLRIED